MTKNIFITSSLMSNAFLLSYFSYILIPIDIVCFLIASTFGLFLGKYFYKEKENDKE